MKKMKWLGVWICVMVLLLSFGAGAIASVGASGIYIEKAPEKIELETFLERIINIYPKENNPRTNDLPKNVWWIETDDFATEGSHVIEFKPRRIQVDEHLGTYFVKVWIDFALLVVPTNNIDIYDEEITLSTEIWVQASFRNLEELFEFQEEILLAMKGNKKVSMEVKLGYQARVIGANTVEKYTTVPFWVVFLKK